MQEDQAATASMMIFVKDSTFKMPQSFETPCVMVGPGTGLVPFIGFMQEREKAQADNEALALGPAHLYFGCREKDTDFIYRDYMAEMKDRGVISELNLAFSRALEEGAVKTYVQNLLEQHGDMLREVVVDKAGCFYVCGATNMGKAVELILKEAIGEDAFKQMQKEKRYMVELWSS